MEVVQVLAVRGGLALAYGSAVPGPRAVVGRDAVVAPLIRPVVPRLAALPGLLRLAAPARGLGTVAARG
ncbi:hypothetical protein ACFYZB_20815 [Streptomyces sp. NPDC001852]|uniref:hypothetical protein n=1 Tax=Streptomyces sp. NPDC001852 TaxID=3364619 RepID=UPI0036A146B0